MPLQQRGQTAIEAAEQIRKQRQEYRRTLEMELEQACYEAKLAQRRYQAIDPDHRLVAAELESRWNAAFVWGLQLNCCVAAKFSF